VVVVVVVVVLDIVVEELFEQLVDVELLQFVQHALDLDAVVDTAAVAELFEQPVDVELLRCEPQKSLLTKTKICITKHSKLHYQYSYELLSKTYF
jgi:hypothetical protein